MSFITSEFAYWRIQLVSKTVRRNAGTTSDDDATAGDGGSQSRCLTTQFVETDSTP